MHQQKCIGLLSTHEPLKQKRSLPALGFSHRLSSQPMLMSGLNQFFASLGLIWKSTYKETESANRYQYSQNLTADKMANTPQYYVVRRKSELDAYFQWCYPYRNYIGEPRSRDTLVADLKFALLRETGHNCHNHEIVMCRNTKFHEIFLLSHVLLNFLPILIEPHLIQTYVSNSEYYEACEIEDMGMEIDFPYSSQEESHYSSDESCYSV